uniref:Uncharacterized protein n=2 Tax=Calcidiscus leptoporus TaxID=127549 RepID=A0A7S0JHV9_9EUKA|mmetsp:Transcript_5954/g.13826  ORF Transcript_5954/g.13826 Transcript_5954/m.13826 type:complete len:179 (+) Transcript_5954:58-594(+)
MAVRCWGALLFAARLVVMCAFVSGLPHASTHEEVQAAYAQAGERFAELRERFAPVGKDMLRSKLPDVLERASGQLQSFIGSLDFAPSLATVGKLIDRMAWGPKANDPRSGSHLSASQCGDSEACVQVINAVKSVTDVFRGKSMLFPPFFQGRTGTDAGMNNFITPSPAPLPDPEAQLP